MNILYTKLQRDMRQSIGMLAAIVAIIAVGIASFVCMLGAYSNLDTAKTVYYSECRMADFWVDLKKAPAHEALNRCNIPGISELRDRISFPVMIDFEGESRPVNAVAISMPSERKPVINDIILRSGTWFTPDQRNQLVVSEKFAKARNLEPGSRLNVLVDGQLRPFIVTGTAISSEYVYLTQPGSMMDDPKNYGVLYMKRDYAEEVFDFDGACNSMVGRLTPEAKKLGAQNVYDELKLKLEPYGVFAVTPLDLQTSNMSLAAEMGALQSMATMLPVFFLAVAALVMNVLMSRMAEQQRVVIGTLKALGYTDREIGNHFRCYGFAVGACGGALGCMLGYWMAGGMVNTYQTVFTFPSLYNQLFPGLMITGCLVAVVFSVLGSIRGVRRVVHLNPSEAMRQPAPPVGSKIMLERLPRFWNNIDFTWQMLFRNLFRQKSRTLVAVFAATAGSALVLLSIGMLNSMDYMITYQFSKTVHADYTLNFKDPVRHDALQYVRDNPGVAKAEPLLEIAGTIRNFNRNKKTVITGLSHDAELTSLYSGNGMPVQPPAFGIALSDRLAEELDVKAGDTVIFEPVRGDIKSIRINVETVFKSVLGIPAYADIRQLSAWMGEEDTLTSVQVQGRMNNEQEKSFFQSMKQAPMLQSIASIADQKNAITKQFNQSLQGMVFIMILFAAVIFFGSILNGALIAIAERKREIATFRVLGYNAREISGIFLRENLLTNMTGALAGLPAGYYLLNGMMTQFNSDAYRFPTVVRGTTWIYTIILAFLFVLAAQLIVHRQIDKIDWQEALSMKE